MENKMEIFRNNEFGEIKAIKIEEEIWFVAKEIAEKLGYANPQKAIREHIDEDDKGVTEMDTPGGKQRVNIINESGLYSLILSSKLPSAKKFKHWVTDEVLPTIRTHGMYATDKLLDNPDFAIKVFEQLKQEREQRKKLEVTIEEQKSKVLFADAVETAKTSILVGDMAKILKQNGINIGQNRLFEWLRDNDYLIKTGERKNMPTQKSMNLGLFEIKERTVVNPDGSNRLTRTTKVTGKGQQYFISKFLFE